MRTTNCFKKMYVKPNWILIKCGVVWVELILVRAVNQKLNKLSNSSFPNGWKWPVRSKLYRNRSKGSLSSLNIEKIWKKLNMRRNWTEWKSEALCWWLWQKIAPHYVNVFCVVFHDTDKLKNKQEMKLLNKPTADHKKGKEPINYHIKWNQHHFDQWANEWSAILLTSRWMCYNSDGHDRKS